MMSSTEQRQQQAFNPAETMQLYADIARKSGELLTRVMQRAGNPKSGFDDELGIARAFFDAWVKMASDPMQMAQAQMKAWQDYAALWQNALLAMTGQKPAPAIETQKGDRRFRHEDWQNKFLFDYLKQSYLIASRHLHKAMCDVQGLDETAAKKVDFYTRQYIDALSPSNFALTNPEVLNETVRSGGKNLLKGFNNLLDDLARADGAGLRVKMITGDHAVTAAAIGRQLGLRADRALTGEAVQAMDPESLGRASFATDVFARASPEHKLRLVAAMQAQGELVAMTGDGVNDAPALKAANIGVAMGHKGTDAAREAADLVLTDDNFATIARAVREGRVVFDNIKKSLLFMLPTSSGEAGVILIAVFAGVALPITAGQILWVNTVTAVTLSLALAFEAAEPGVMRRPPRRPSEPLITPVLAFRIAYVSLLMIAVTFGVFEWELARGSGIEVARTAAVNMLVVGELVYLFNVRHFTAHSFTRDILSGNPVAFGVSVLLVVFQLLFTYAPPMQQLFQTAALDAATWLVILVLGFGKFLAVEAEKAVLRCLHVRSM